MSEAEGKEVILEGIAVSPGICIGKAYIVDREGVDVVRRYYISGIKLHNEKMRFKTAVKKAIDELHKIIYEAPDLKGHRSILDTHVAMLKDKLLYDSTIETIEKEQVNAEWALKKVATNLQARFKSMSDEYLRERSADIAHVSDRIMRHLVGADSVNLKDIDKRVILVADDLSPAETSQIQLDKIQGFVTEAGGLTSHTGIIARSLELPAIQGVNEATDIIKNDDTIIVDGCNGIIVINPTEDTLVKFVKNRVGFESFRSAVARSSSLPAKTMDGEFIQVMGNIEFPEEVVSVKSHGGDGIGLYRTEFLYLSRNDFPSESELFDKYKDVVEVMAPKPVIIRTLDINGDKAMPHSSRNRAEQNPALGLRGIRYCLKRKNIFLTQLRAILRAAVFGNVRVMFPMISTIEEMIEARSILNQAAESLEQEGVEFKKDLPVGAMIEVPSAVIMADTIAKAVDFFSIGTNDLIQYALAIDRGNHHLAYLYHPLHPAVLRMIQQTSEAAKSCGIKVFMCGEMASEPLYVPILLGLGIDELSMNPQSMPAVKSIIRGLDMKQTRMFIKDVLKQTRSEDVLNLTKEAYSGMISGQWSMK